MTAVFLDVDGTIVDSNLHHAIAWQRAFAEHGHEITTAILLPLMGVGGDHLVERVLDAQAETGIGDDVRAAHDKHFTPMLDWIHPMPGARELVEAMLSRDVQVVLATSSGIDHVKLHARQVGLDLDRLTFVTAEDIEHTKPSPDVYLAALEKTGSTPGDALAIGDTRWDVQSATAAGIRSIAIPSAGGRAHELLGAGAVAVYPDAASLVSKLDAALALAGTEPAGATR
jgi:HAD superfamily hydrolase (TIGR01509 family)